MTTTTISSGVDADIPGPLWSVPSNTTTYGSGGHRVISAPLISVSTAGLVTAPHQLQERLNRQMADVLTATSRKGWDTYGATPVAAELGAAVAAWLSQVVGAVDHLPVVSATPLGGLRAEWESTRGYLEVTFQPLTTATIEMDLDDSESSWRLVGSDDFVRFARMLWLLFA